MSNHPIVHIELAAQDPEAAGKFYREVFGWQVRSDPTFDYHMFQAEGGPGGGFVKVSTEPSADEVTYRPGDVLVYIGTDDIDATLAVIEQHGGKILLSRTEIPGTGWFGIFADPSGTRVALYTPMERTAQNAQG